MQKVKIAVIDNGIDDTCLNYNLGGKLSIDDKNRCIADEADMGNVNFIHGTICACIIQKYCPDSELYSLRILNEKGKGLIERLEPALRWCLEKEIRVVNLSLGTTHFRDEKRIRTIINDYAARGLFIIAATANNGKETYPASFSNVIGVKAISEENDAASDMQMGIDVLALAEHEIELHGEKTVTPKSNSYAAPFVTALVGGLFAGRNYDNIAEIKNELKRCQRKEIKIVEGCCEPDWVCNAQVRAGRPKCKADYYFQAADDREKAEFGRADTMILDDLSDMDTVGSFKRHIIYLGEEEFERETQDRFFWNPYHQKKRIRDSIVCKNDLNIPVILCGFENAIDGIFLLTELKRYFAREEYNIYTASLEPDSVLYDLEYLPEDCLRYKDKIRAFIQRQTYGKQSDGIIIGAAEENIIELRGVFEEIEIEVHVQKLEQGDQISVFYEHGTLEIPTAAEINEVSVKNIADQVIRVLTEEDS